MLVQQFSENPFQYKGFEVWDVENMEAFFKGNGVLKEIFEKEYKILITDFEDKRHELPETNLGIIANILDQIGDKHFLIFTLHDPNHLELIQMQNTKVMNFGMDIQEIVPEHVYILIMDKVKEVSVGL
jgi:hypothetical protein